MTETPGNSFVMKKVLLTAMTNTISAGHILNTLENMVFAITESYSATINYTN